MVSTVSLPSTLIWSHNGLQWQVVSEWQFYPLHWTSHVRGASWFHNFFSSSIPCNHPKGCRLPQNRWFFQLLFSGGSPGFKQGEQRARQRIEQSNPLLENKSFKKRKCLNVHSVCTNFCLNVHSVCTNFCLNVHSPGLLWSPCKYGKGMYKFVFYA